MDRKLLDYLPPVLREVMEMQAINEANEPEIAIAWDAITLVLANQFLETADVRGVSIWEKELKIIAKDTDSLELRKARIKAQWNTKLPYSVPWLRSWLSGICGPDGYDVSISNYVIHLRLYLSKLPECMGVDILNTLLLVCPCNMLMLMTEVIGPEEFCNKPGSPILRQFGMCMAFSNLRGEKCIRFDGETGFDGGIRFNQDAGGVALAKVSYRTASLHRHTVSVKLTRDAGQSFGGEFSFDGAYQFNSNYSEEVL